jgi:hypothetical protein
MHVDGVNSPDSLYTKPLARYLQYNFKTERQWDTIRNGEGITGYKYPGAAGKVNYAFHPFWMGTCYNRYEFQNIKRIGYFGYFIFSDNSDWLKAYSWTTTSLLKTAEEEDCKVDIVVFCNGTANIDLVLNDNLFQAIEVEDIIALSKANVAQGSGSERDASGVNIYFSGLTAAQIPKFKFFLQYCRQILHQNDMELVLSIARADSLLFDGSILAVPDIITTADFDYFGNVGNGMYITTNNTPGKAQSNVNDNSGQTDKQGGESSDTILFLKKVADVFREVPGVIKKIWYSIQDNPPNMASQPENISDQVGISGAGFIMFAVLVLVLNVLSVALLSLFILFYLSSKVHDFISGYMKPFGVVSGVIVLLNIMLLVLSFGNLWQIIIFVLTLGLVFLGIMPFIHTRKRPLP